MNKTYYIFETKQGLAALDFVPEDWNVLNVVYADNSDNALEMHLDEDLRK
jgi:hypothetical protein